MSEDGLANLDMLATASAAPAACGAGFEPCGGLLAGTWTVEGVCNEEAVDPDTLQRRVQSFMGLDAAGCPDIVRSFSSYWDGGFVFNRGVFIDQRARIDAYELELSRSCLNATFGVDIRAEKLGAACTALDSASMNCTAAGDACLCSAQREQRLEGAGSYGVLGTQVAIGPDRPPQLADYCVLGDLLQWQEPGTLQRLLLRLTVRPPTY